MKRTSNWKICPQIDWYIFKITFISSLLALLLLSIIETFFTFLTELQDLKQDSYTISQMLTYIFYDTPERVYRIFPMSLLLGTMLGLGQLSSSNELTALRATGLSKLRLMAGAVVAILCLSVVSFSIGEFGVPLANSLAIKNNTGTKNLREGKGFWAISEGRILHVAASYKSDLKNITIFDIKDNQLVKTITAEKAILNERNWDIKDGVERHYLDDEIKNNNFASMTFPTVIDKTALAALIAGGESLSIKDLYKFIRYLEANGLDANDYRLTFWSKLFGPLFNLSMLLISMRFIFVHNRKSGVGARLVIGISIGLLIFLITRMLGYFILLYGYMPILGAILPTLLASSLGILLLQVERQAN